MLSHRDAEPRATARSAPQFLGLLPATCNCSSRACPPLNARAATYSITMVLDCTILLLRGLAPRARHRVEVVAGRRTLGRVAAPRAATPHRRREDPRLGSFALRYPRGLQGTHAPVPVTARACAHVPSHALAMQESELCSRTVSRCRYTPKVSQSVPPGVCTAHVQPGDVLDPHRCFLGERAAGSSNPGALLVRAV